MKNWIFLFLILGSGLSVSFELPAQALSNLHETSEEESSFFKVLLTHKSVGEEEENVYTFTFKEKEELVEKFLEMEESLSQDMLFQAKSYAMDEEDRNFQRRAVSDSYGFPIMRGWGDSGDVDIEPKTEEAKPFFDLPLSNDDKKNIRKLITTMADKNILQLLMEKKSMEKLGDKIRPVHPLKFAAFILKDPYLKKCLRTIEKDSLKWGPFVDGYEEKMRAEVKAGRMLVYLPGFVEFIDGDAKQIQKLIQNKDYAGLLTDL